MSQDSKKLFKSKNGWSIVLYDDNEIVVRDRSRHRYCGNRGAIKRTYNIAKAVMDKFHPDDRAEAMLELLKWCQTKAEHMGEKDIYNDQ